MVEILQLIHCVTHTPFFMLCASKHDPRRQTCLGCLQMFYMRVTFSSIMSLPWSISPLIYKLAGGMHA